MPRVPFSAVRSLAALPLLSGLTACGHAQTSPAIETTVVSKQTLPPTDYRRLRDVVVFNKEKLGQWAGSGEGMKLQVESDNTLPLDETQKYGNRPSYKIAATGSGGWWQLKLAGLNWATYDLHNHFDEGFLLFNIKGAQGGEKFKIALETKGAAGKGPDVMSTQFVEVGADWKPVKISLRQLFDANKKESLRQTWILNFSSADDKPVTFWLNDIRYTSPGNEPGFPAIKVNQLGYATKAPKYALVSGFPDELRAQAGTPFEVLRNGKAVFSGKLTLLSNFDERASGERVLKADFSSLSAPGEYSIRVGADNSPKFRIGDDIYTKFLVDAARYFYLQRSGTVLDAKHAGKYARGMGHPQDAKLPFQSDPQGPTRDASGGWYDAGDYGKYVSMAAVPVSDLLWSFETFPTQFKDNQFNIPESGNGVPDILDEVRWELDWILKMQDAASSGFYQKVWPNNSDQTPDKDKSQRFVYDKVGEQKNVRATATTANAVAVLARGSVAFKTVDREYSQKLLRAAQNGWKYLQAHPEDIVVRGMTGSDENDDDNRQWAAAELYRANGDASGRKHFLENYQKFTKYWQSKNDNAYGEDLSMLALLAYMKTPSPDAQVKSWFRNQFNTWRTTNIERWKKSVWQNVLLDEDYYWGSNAVALQTNLLLAVGSKILGTYDREIVDVSRANLNYILGVNPLRFSYVTGYGEDCVKNIYSHIWTHDDQPLPPPGYLAGGANQYEGKAFSRFAAKCYSDVNSEWTTNENAIYWNSVLVFTAAMLNEEAKR